MECGRFPIGLHAPKPGVDSGSGHRLRRLHVRHRSLRTSTRRRQHNLPILGSSEIRGRKLEVRGRKSDVGAQRSSSEANSLNSQPSTLNHPRSGYVELPYTLPQDSTLFLLLREKTNGIWKTKLDWIAQHGGMALLNTHPDYMRFDGCGDFAGVPGNPI